MPFSMPKERGQLEVPLNTIGLEVVWLDVFVLS